MLPNSELTTSGWWIGRELGDGRRAEASLTRNELIELWVKASPSPKPNVKHFAEDLAKWTSELGTRAWVEELTVPEAARRMRQGTNQTAIGVEIWDMVCGIAAAYGDPFARCSADVVQNVRKERPRNLPRAMASAIRKYEDGPPRTAARNAMIGSEACGAVVSSRGHADRFVADAEPFKNAIVASAVRAYSGRLVDYLDRIADVSEQEDLEILSAAIERMTDEYGEPDIADRLPTVEEIEFADARLHWYLDQTGIAATDSEIPLVQGSNLYTISDVVGEGWRRARRNLVRLHIDEVELTDDLVVRVYKSNLNRATQDLQRKVFKSARQSTSPEAQQESDHASSSVHPIGVALGYRGVLMRLLFDRAHAYVSKSLIESNHPWGGAFDGPWPCWEREIVLDILASDAQALSDGSVSEIAEFVDRGAARAMVRHLFDIHKPTNTLAPTPDKSITLVLQLLQGSLAMAIGDDDVIGSDGIELVGHKAVGQTWAQKSAAVLQDLRKHRRGWTELTEMNR